MLTSIKVENCPSFDLALVRWYDFKYNDPRRLYKYDCPLLKLTEMYNFVPVDLIIELVHIIQHAEKQNDYLHNIYMF